MASRWGPRSALFGGALVRPGRSGRERGGEGGGARRRSRSRQRSRGGGEGEGQSPAADSPPLPILYLHGMGVGLLLHARALLMLARAFPASTVVAPQLPYIACQLTSDVRTPDEEAARVAAWTREAGVGAEEPVALVAQSYGTLVAARLLDPDTCPPELRYPRDGGGVGPASRGSGSRRGRCRSRGRASGDAAAATGNPWGLTVSRVALFDPAALLLCSTGALQTLVFGTRRAPQVGAAFRAGGIPGLAAELWRSGPGWLFAGEVGLRCCMGRRLRWSRSHLPVERLPEGACVVLGRDDQLLPVASIAAELRGPRAPPGVTVVADDHWHGKSILHEATMEEALGAMRRWMGDQHG